jgi:hypothetical protein
MRGHGYTRTRGLLVPGPEGMRGVKKMRGQKFARLRGHLFTRVRGQLSAMLLFARVRGQLFTRVRGLFARVRGLFARLRGLFARLRGLFARVKGKLCARSKRQHYAKVRQAKLRGLGFAWVREQMLPKMMGLSKMRGQMVVVRWGITNMRKGQRVLVVLRIAMMEGV